MNPGRSNIRFSALRLLFASLLIAVSITLQGQSCGYSYKKLITVNHSMVSGTSPHFDFPMLISLTDNNLRTVANGGRVTNVNGYDILFLTEEGEQIAHQLERYVATTGQLIAWLRLPKLYVEDNTVIQMIYGNSLATTNPSTTTTWNSNYQAVWHLQDDFNDGTSFANNGTNSGSVDFAGKIGDGQSFDGINDRIFRTDATLNGSIPSKSSGSPTQFTLSGWMLIDVLNARRPLLTKQGDGAGNDRGFSFMMEADNRLKVELFKNNVSGDRTEVYSTATLSAATWYYLTMTYNFIADGTSEVRLYINGASNGSTNASVGPIFTNARDLDIGRYFWAAGTEYYHDGLIDEVRISNTVHSADWIATEYANQNSPSTFYSVGNETGGTYVPTIPTCGSGFMKSITINGPQVAGSGSHTDFPVLISLTDNDLRTVANGGDVQNANGYDIVFTDANLIPLDHQIEAYTATSGRYVAWVRIPSLPASTNTTIYMLYGNPDVFVNPSTRCTWNSNHTAVWHLHDDLLDATSNNYTATNNGSTDNTTSIIASGQSFDGTQFIEVPAFPNQTSNFTISGWIRTTNNTIAGQRVFCDDVNNTGGYALSLGDGGTGSLRFYSRGMSSVILDAPGGLIANNTWYYVAGVVDRTNLDRIIYINGVAVASNLNDAGTWGSDNGNASIGGETNSGESGNRFRGSLDEIRIANTVRSAGWLLTEYNNQNSPATFYTVGSEIALNATSTQNGDWDQTSRWSTGAIPGLGANVTILHDIDLDDRNETICNLTVIGSGNVASAFEIQSGYALKVLRDVFLTNNSDDDDITLRVMNNNSKLTIAGDLFVSHESGDDLFIDLDNAGDSIIIHGNVSIEHDGGDDIMISIDNATAVLQANQSFVANMNSGTDDLLTFDLNSGQFNVSGNLIVNRYADYGDILFDMDGGNLTADSVYIGTFSGSGNDVVSIYIDATSVFTSNSGMHIQMAGADDIEIYLNNAAGTAATLLINGNLLIDKTDGDDINIIVDDDNSLFRITGNFILNSSGGEQITIELDNDAIFDVDGNLTWTHTQGEVEEIILNGGGDNPTFNVDGNFSVVLSGGNDQFLLNLDGGTLRTGGNFTVTKNNNTGNVLYDMDGGTITAVGAFSAVHQGNGQFFIDMDGASVINAGSFDAVLSGGTTAELMLIDLDNNAQINVTNNALLQANSGNDMEFHLGENTGGSTAQFNVGGNLTLDHNGSSVDDMQLIVNDAAVVTVNGNFTMSCVASTGVGNFFTRLNNTARLTVGSNIVLDNSFAQGLVEIEMNNATLLQIGGNFVRNAAPNDFGLVQTNTANTTIEYNGTAAQIFADDDGGGTDGIEYELVIINNSFGTEPQLTMAAPVTLTNNITFTDGVLQTTAVNLLTIADNATANSGNANSYVSGPMGKRGNDAFVFPLGKNGRWARLGISNLLSTSPTDGFIAEYFDTPYAEVFWDSVSYGGTTDGIYNTSLVEHWDLARTSGTVQPQVTLYWNDNVSSFINDTADLLVAHYIGGNAWINEGGAASGTLASGAVRSTSNITSFSVFTFGSASPSVNPLPVELLSFDAIPQAQVVLLNWVTLSEINNDYFTVERSVDGIYFEPVVRLPGAGNSHQQRQYTVADDGPLDGISYYRLKQTDYNGEFSYSVIRVVEMDETDRLMAFPNPTNSGIIHFNQLTSGSLYAANGRLVKSLDHADHILTGEIEPGVYTFRSDKGEVVRIVIL